MKTLLKAIPEILAFFVVAAIVFAAGMEWQRDHARRPNLNRYQMHVMPGGAVYCLDKQTGVIHVNTGAGAGYLPEFFFPSPTPMSAEEFLDAPDTPTPAPITPTFADSQPSQ